MSKEESTILKGVAILLMVFLHLFNKTNLPEICTPLLYIGDLPLVHVMSRACNPVAFFVILSGYGLSYVYHQNKLSLPSQGRRLLKLYIHYWIILLIFVPIGCAISPWQYPGDLWNVLGNITSYTHTYNYEIWFLFPYALLSLTAYPIFKSIDKIGIVASFLFWLLVSLACGYVVSRYIAAYKNYDSPFSLPLTYLGMVFPFVLGACFFRLSKGQHLRVRLMERKPLIPLSLLAVLFIGRCCFTTSAFNSLYAILFIWLFLQIPLWTWFRKFLIIMGKHSMPMWMTHTFFSNYLFHDFIFGFQYPLLIYLVLILVSYLVSIPVLWIGGHIWESLPLATNRERIRRR